MKIIILGAGQVGRTVAEIMATEDNDITVVDRQEAVLRDLQQRLDIRTVVGHASYPNVLLRAGAEDAELVFAVTNDDEVNMVACQVAYTLFQTPTRLARVRSADYLSHPGLFQPNAMPVTYLINPEQMVTTDIQRLIEHPGALEVFDFAGGKIQLASTRVLAGASMAGQEVAALGAQVGEARARVVAVYRNGHVLADAGDCSLEAGDVVYFFAAERDVQPVIAAFHMDGHVNRHIIIAGGGNLGARLARLLEPTHQVKIIEHDHARCRYLAGSLHRTLVLNGDATDGTLLEGEGIEATDVFCAATNEDRTNVVAAMLAKRMGARRTLAIVNSASHGLLTEQAALDIALTPAEVTIGALLTHIRRGDVVGVRSLRRGTAEALELIARGDRSTSRAVGRPIRELALPDSVRIGALLRKEQVILPGADTVIETDDHVMLLLADKTQVDAVEAAFRVAITFV